MSFWTGYTGNQDEISNTAPTVTPNAPQVTKPSTNPKEKGNLFTHFLPAIGATVGGILASPLNALDAVTGVGGTALDLGAAGLGAAGGKAVENYLEGDGGSITKQLPGILGQGALGVASAGIGNAVAPLVTKAAGPAVDAIGSLLGKGSTEAAAEAATQSAPKLTSGGLQELTGQMGQNIVKAAPNFNPGVSKQFLLDKAPQLAELANKLGISPQNYEALGKAGTGADGAINTIKVNLLKGVNGVDTSGMKDIVGNLVNDAHELTGPVADKLATNLTNKITNASGDISGSLTGEQAHGLIQSFSNSASKSFGKPEARIYQGLANELNDRLSAAGADKAVAGFSVAPKDLALIQKTIANQGFTGDAAKNIEDYIVNAANNAKSLNELKATESPLVNLSNIGQGLRRSLTPEQGASSAVSGVTKGMGGITSRVLKAAASPLTNTISGIATKGIPGFLGELLSPAGLTETATEAVGTNAPRIAQNIEYQSNSVQPQNFAPPSEEIRNLIKTSNNQGQKIPVSAITSVNKYQTGLNELNKIQDNLNSNGSFDKVSSQLKQSASVLQQAGLDSNTIKSLLPNADDNQREAQTKLQQLRSILDASASTSIRSSINKTSGNTSNLLNSYLKAIK